MEQFDKNVFYVESIYKSICIWIDTKSSMSKSSACLGFVLRWWRVVTSVSVSPALGERGSEPRGGSGSGSGCGCNKWEADWAGLETVICVSDAGNCWADPGTQTGAAWSWHVSWYVMTSDDLWRHVTICDEISFYAIVMNPWWHKIACDDTWHVTRDSSESEWRGPGTDWWGSRGSTYTISSQGINSNSSRFISLPFQCSLLP